MIAAALRNPAGIAALRRAGRAAIVMPAMFALGDKVIANAAVATFAAFGSFALLLLVEFAGPMQSRLQAQAALGLVGGVFVCVGTVASHSAWLAALAMTVVGFGVLFAGVVSSALAGATTSLLLAFILPVSLPGPVSQIPDRLAGWGLATVGSLFAIALLWPAPVRDPVRGKAIAACRALAARLRSREASADAAVAALQTAFFATPYRPTGLSTAARTIVRLIDELKWLNAIVSGAEGFTGGPRVDAGTAEARPAAAAPRDGGAEARAAAAAPRDGGAEARPAAADAAADPDAAAVNAAAATVLERGADLLDAPGGSPEPLRAALGELRAALDALEAAATRQLPSPDNALSSLDPSFRAQELSYVVSQIAGNIDLAAAAERRSWLEQLLGRRPSGLAGPLAAAQERAGAHVERHSVWLRNSVRGAVALGLAVLIADLTGVQHAFWVVLGTLSVLRSNALNTGQSVLRGLLGTAAGFVVGGILVALVGTNTTVLWVLLPPAILLAGLAPVTVGFATGQAAFTLTLLILFNLIAPEGWRIGLVRIEDIAIGGAVSLLVGVLFWPRGAAAALGVALAEAYRDSADYLAGAVLFGVGRCDASAPARSAPTEEAARAAAASRRLDDTFRGFLAERGAKPIPLAEVTSLVTGVVGLRLAADAVLDLWQREDSAGGDRAAARRELLAAADEMTTWYSGFAAGLVGQGALPAPLGHDDQADGRLVTAVSQDLRGSDGEATATAVRVIWTGDHLDAARRLQDALIDPARAAVREHALAANNR